MKAFRDIEYIGGHPELPGPCLVIVDFLLQRKGLIITSGIQQIEIGFFDLFLVYISRASKEPADGTAALKLSRSDLKKNNSYGDGVLSSIKWIASAFSTIFGVKKQPPGYVHFEF